MRLLDIRYQFPMVIQRLMRGVVFRGDISQRNVYITFDDGPVPQVTPALLDLLDVYGVKATFFCVGENVQRYPDLARKVMQRGHTLACHTYHHLRGWSVSTTDYLNDVALAEQTMRSVLGPGWNNTRLFRPPHGRMTWPQYRALRATHRIVLWDVLTHDYDAAHYSAKRIHSLVQRLVREGSIITFHDSVKAQPVMLDAVEKTITTLQQSGYSFLRL